MSPIGKTEYSGSFTIEIEEPDDLEMMANALGLDLLYINDEPFIVTE